MIFDPDIHHRRSIRLRGYDYTSAGAYFITVCTHNRMCLFGHIEQDKMFLNAWGDIVDECWQATPQHFSHTELDEYVIMPNHIHGIIWIVRCTDGAMNGNAMNGAMPNVGATHASPLRSRGPKPRSIGAIVGSFKSAVTKRINEIRGTPGKMVWQRNYYEHIIRNERSLERIRRYIRMNPGQWEYDNENPICEK